MKSIITIVVAAGLACATLSSRANLVLNFNSTTETLLGFADGGFGFAPEGQSQPLPAFRTAGASGSSASGDSNGDTGMFGTERVQITSINAAGTQGTLSGANTLQISDPAANPPTVNSAHTLYADVNWSTISLVAGQYVNQLTVTGNLGPDLALSNSSVLYTGAQGDMQYLASATDAIISVTYNTGLSNLNDLALTRPDWTLFYYGEIEASNSAVPEPTTFFVGALLLLPLGLATLRWIRKHSGCARA
jgi:hypothetical protein